MVISLALLHFRSRSHIGNVTGREKKGREWQSASRWPFGRIKGRVGFHRPAFQSWTENKASTLKRAKKSLIIAVYCGRQPDSNSFQAISASIMFRFISDSPHVIEIVYWDTSYRILQWWHMWWYSCLCWWKGLILSNANNSDPSPILSRLLMPSQKVTQSSSVLLQDARSACKCLPRDVINRWWIGGDRSPGDSVVT